MKTRAVIVGSHHNIGYYIDDEGFIDGYVSRGNFVYAVFVVTKSKKSQVGDVKVVSLEHIRITL